MVLSLSGVVTGIAMILTSEQRVPWRAAGFISLASAATAIWNVVTMALRQRAVPDELLGRVSAAYRLMVFVAMPLGALAGGLIADYSSARSALFIGGLGVAASGLVCRPALRTHFPPSKP